MPNLVKLPPFLQGESDHQDQLKRHKSQPSKIYDTKFSALKSGPGKNLTLDRVKIKENTILFAYFCRLN